MPDYLASHLLLDQLGVEGTRFIFGSFAAAGSPLVRAVHDTRSDIHFLAALHDDVATTMATGYAQASGRPGIVSLPGGPGLTSALSSLYNAYHGRVPLIVLADQQDTQILSEDPPLGADIGQMASGVTKWQCELKTAGEIPRIVRRAFHEALSPPKGPVIVSLPVNMLVKPSAGRTISPPQSSPLGAADASFLKKASKSLVQAHRPCVIAGNEVSQYRARREAVSLVEVLGCPAFSEPMPTGINFPNRHPQFGGVLPTDLHEANRLLANFDLILVLGMQTRIPARVHEPSLIPTSASVIQINIEPGLAGRTLPCHLSANADIAESLSRLRAEIQLIVNPDWVEAAKNRAQETISTIAKSKQSREESLVYPGTKAPISLFWLMRMLDVARPQQSIIVNDMLMTQTDPFSILSLESSSAYFAQNSGVWGYSPAAALGIAWASPDHVAIALTSDQSTLYYPQTLWTAAHYGLNTKFIVVNNQARRTFNIQIFDQQPTGSRLLLENPPFLFTSLAAAMNVPSAKITKMGDLEGSLTRMFETQGPYLLDVSVSEENPS